MYAAIITKTQFSPIGPCKKDVTPLLTQWSYVFLPLTQTTCRCTVRDAANTVMSLTSPYAKGIIIPHVRYVFYFGTGPNATIVK